MPLDTRSDILAAARRQFAEKGFYGASIAAIAGELGVTKQALLHHFGRKEALYGEVLETLAAEFLARVMQASAAPTPEARIEALMITMLEDCLARPDETRLLMRELLDNPARAKTARTWYLRPFLDAQVAMIRAVPGWESATDAETLAALYQLLGAVNYFAVSGPTLRRMYGDAAHQAMSDVYPSQLRNLVRAQLNTARS